MTAPAHGVAGEPIEVVIQSFGGRLQLQGNYEDRTRAIALPAFASSIWNAFLMVKLYAPLNSSVSITGFSLVLPSRGEWRIEVIG